MGINEFTFQHRRVRHRRRLDPAEGLQRKTMAGPEQPAASGRAAKGRGAHAMLIPTQVTFRGMGRVDWLEAEIQERAAGLERYYPSITGCRVVEPPHRHHQDGNRYHVRVDLTVPGEEVVVSREASLHAAEQDAGVSFHSIRAEVGPERRYANVAVREAFEAARRQLQDVRRRQRGAVKIHEHAPRGRIVKLSPDENCGFIAAADGHEVYFHRNSVLNAGFDRLDIGHEVVFVEEMGDRGPQASTVRTVAQRRAPVCGITPLTDQAPAHRPLRVRRRKA